MDNTIPKIIMMNERKIKIENPGIETLVTSLRLGNITPKNTKVRNKAIIPSIITARGFCCARLFIEKYEVYNL